MTNPWGASPGDARNWYAADLGITTVSGKVSVWANQGSTGSADDLAQSTSGNRPTYVASHTPNSKPAVRFDPSASTYMQTPAFGSSVGGANTFFIVFQRDGASTYYSGVSEMVMSTVDDGATGPDYAWEVYLYNGFSDADYLLMGADGGLQIARACTMFRKGVGLLVGGADSVPTTGAPQRINSADWGPFTSTSSRGIKGLTFGAYSPLGGPIGFFFDGVIQEFILFGSVLSLSDIQAVELYLSCKYKIPQALPHRRTMLNYGGPIRKSGLGHRRGVQADVYSRWFANGRWSTRAQDKPSGPGNINSTMRSLLLVADRARGDATLPIVGPTFSGTGTHSAGGTSGTADFPLPTLTEAASGTETMTGTAAIPVPNLVPTFFGTERFVGSVALPLPSPGLAASGTETIDGSAAPALALSLSAAGTETVDGAASLACVVVLAVTCAETMTGSATLPIVGPGLACSGAEEMAGTCDLGASLSLSAAGVCANPVAGTCALALVAGLSAAGEEGMSGSASLSCALALSAAGAETLSGTCDLPLAVALAASGLCAQAVTGTCDVVLLAALAASGVAGTGAVSGTAALAVVVALDAAGTETVTGTSSSALPGPGLAVAGSEAMTGTASLALVASLAAVGSSASPVSGTCALVATLACSASGTETLTGAASLGLTPALAVVGAETMAGAAALDVAGPGLDAAGAETVRGSAALSLAPVLDATGTHVPPPVTGSSALEVSIALAAVGALELGATCALVLPGPVLAAVGWHAAPVAAVWMTARAAAVVARSGSAAVVAMTGAAAGVVAVTGHVAAPVVMGAEEAGVVATRG